MMLVACDWGRNLREPCADRLVNVDHSFDILARSDSEKIEAHTVADIIPTIINESCLSGCGDITTNSVTRL
jgi:hypothetical protein